MPPQLRSTHGLQRHPGRRSMLGCPLKPDRHRRRAAEASAPDSAPSAGNRAADVTIPDFTVSQHVLTRNAELAARLKDQLILAPLTRGGNLPFRRLCVEYGAEVTMSEMIFARGLIKGDPVEKARLYRHPSEACFGVQIATNTIDEGVKAAEIAAQAGASFLDINCGCPIHEATRRGLGAALLRKPTKLARMINGIVERASLPVTVKIRTGENEGHINAPYVAELLEAAGAAAVTIHGRTMLQRYKKAADWDIIAGIAAARPALPIIGNGDLLTHYELGQRRGAAGCHAYMVGRGALIKPFVFQEAKEGRELLLSTEDRVGMLRRLASHMRDHFGDDEKGRRKAFYFFPWHFDFLHRYRHLPEEVYGEHSRSRPLIGTRMDLTAPELGESEEGLSLVERLLRCEAPEAHAAVAEAIWDAPSDGACMAALEALAGRQLAEWQASVREGSGSRTDRDEQGQG